MGEVYLASDPQLGRRVALKFLHCNDPELVERFLREARAQARVEHPSVCQVYEVGEVEGRPYIAMQYIEGRSLDELRGELSLEQKVRLVRDVARGGPRRAQTGLIHRDLKPANILVGRRRRRASSTPTWWTSAWPATRREAGLTRTGLISGTPAYMSPEQAQGAPLDRRTRRLQPRRHALRAADRAAALRRRRARPAPCAGAPGGARAAAPAQSRHPGRPRDHRPQVPGEGPGAALRLGPRAGRRTWTAGSKASRSRPVPPAWPTALGKRLRKHQRSRRRGARRLLVLARAGRRGLRTRWQARERASSPSASASASRSWRRSLRYAALLPRHDVTATKRRLRSELEKIREEMDRLGALAEGRGTTRSGKAIWPCIRTSWPASTWSAPGTRASGPPRRPTPSAGSSALFADKTVAGASSMPSR